MKATRLERRVGNITEKLECFDDEAVTTVEAIPEHQNRFMLTDKDVVMIQSIADKNRIPYDKALSAVLRKSLDLYHWHISKLV
jgi:hypothetical protein